MTMKEKSKLKIEDVYPLMFLPLVRANVKTMSGERWLDMDYIGYPWKSDTVEHEQYVEMRAAVSREVCKHFVAFGTAKGIGWAIKTKFPWLDCSTNTFRELRKHGLDKVRQLRHDFIFERLYVSQLNGYIPASSMIRVAYFPCLYVQAYIVATCAQFPDITGRPDYDQATFFGARFDVDVAKLIWGRCIHVLDVDYMLASHDNPGAVFMRQIFVNMSVKLLPVVIDEQKRNTVLKWVDRMPPVWTTDRGTRESIDELFDSICLDARFNDVELGAFRWLDDDDVPIIRREEGSADEMVGGTTSGGSGDPNAYPEYDHESGVITQATEPQGPRHRLIIQNAADVSTPPQNTKRTHHRVKQKLRRMFASLHNTNAVYIELPRRCMAYICNSPIGRDLPSHA
ncbi:hypothetical protein F4861DRAFT_544349 [Xylaria intraflava]|nr:hypothetical protein F4861DRAFT_544349 [Xylaria intraflava]